MLPPCKSQLDVSSSPTQILPVLDGRTVSAEMVFNKNFFKTKKVRLKESSVEEEQEWWERTLFLWVREARAVSLWSCIAMSLRILIGVLLDLSSYKETKHLPKYFWPLMVDGEGNLSAVQHEVVKTISAVATWILSFMPSKIVTKQAPAYFCGSKTRQESSPVYQRELVIIRWDEFGMLNKATPICMFSSSTIDNSLLLNFRLVDFATIVPVYPAVTLSLSVFLRTVLPDDIASLALDPIQYADGENPWIVDFCSELFITFVFTVGIQVLPVFFQLNSFPRWSMIWLFFPVFNYGVDSYGAASAFCPNVLLTFGLLGHAMPGMRIFCSLLGGMVGGNPRKADQYRLAPTIGLDDGTVSVAASKSRILQARLSYSGENVYRVLSFILSSRSLRFPDHFFEYLVPS
eukprot:scaffold1525_cov142-Cylindrotheca_fusiformis.AAC.43